MKVLIKEQEIDIEPDEVKGTFFEALTSSNMNTDLDLEAHQALTLQTITYDKYQELQDKFLLTDNSMNKFIVRYAFEKKLFNVSFDILIKYELYDLVEKVFYENSNHYLEIVDLQMKGIINCNITDIYNRTTLHLLCLNIHTDLTKKYINYIEVNNINYDYNKQDNKGNTILHLCKDIILDVIKTNKYDYNIQNNDGNTILHLCCIYKCEDIMLELIKTGKCDYNKQNNKGDTILHLCVIYNYKDIILELIKTDSCDYNIQNIDGETILHICAHTHFLSISSNDFIDMFIETGKCDYNIQNDKGETILHKCCYHCLDKWIIKLIETNNCDYSIRDKEGKTILHLCCIYKFGKCIKKLIETGKCDINMKDDDGRTPFEYIENDC
jgi:ankyrin repeat protein